MSEIETRFGTDDDAEQIRAAFYGFVQCYADDADVEGDARIFTEIYGQGVRLRVRLWSADAMAAFLARLQIDVGIQRTPYFE